jgi:hypothetical protein
MVCWADATVAYKTGARRRRPKRTLRDIGILHLGSSLKAAWSACPCNGKRYKV